MGPVAGDFVFQALHSPDHVALNLATGSEYTHCGLVLNDSSGLVVYEAVGPVRAIPLDQWVQQGIDQHCVVMRFNDRAKLLDQNDLEEIRRVADTYIGKGYDSYFNWSDDRIYCSEFVWKAIKLALNIELAQLRLLGSYDLTDSRVQKRLHEKYGDSLPLQEPMISPADLMNSSILDTVLVINKK